MGNRFKFTMVIVIVASILTVMVNNTQDDIEDKQAIMGATTIEQDLRDVPPYTLGELNCTKVIKYPKYKICYDINLKAATAVWYTLYGEDVNRVNIRKRPSFHVDKDIRPEFRASPKDYSHSGFDRGHMAPDATFDYDMETLNSVYSMANIVPQYPTVNRHQWVKAERYERWLAKHEYQVEVINIIKYPANPKRIGKHGIAVPSAFYKILLFDDEIRVFFYANEKKKHKGDKLKDHLIYKGKD